MNKHMTSQGKKGKKRVEETSQDEREKIKDQKLKN